MDRDGTVGKGGGAGRGAWAGAAVVLGVMLASGPLVRAERKAPEPKPASEYAAHDTHPDEHVTVAAEPCDDPKQCSFFRVEYVQHGMLPVRVIITNDSDKALSLDDARIHFLPDGAERVQAATDDDLNRRLFTLHRTGTPRVPLVPLPIPIHHATVDKKITDDEADFGFHGTVVEPHSTAAGYLFYDIQGLDDPALRHAQLLVKQVHTLDGSKELFPFTVPFDAWLKAHPDAPSNHPRQ